jgi:hypothetical protein
MPAGYQFSGTGIGPDPGRAGTVELSSHYERNLL